ncbi:hypothetical protein N3K66_001665 [Trichothecium roseum]|uniref:Uncharacterized protein n=1 Tax=Trichothecium roseum TaxID=47278 RepID=A0ACC0V968_9HYPO|nr:hypothetical protein N3K66_001665 [Trichothecium roseum]
MPRISNIALALAAGSSLSHAHAVTRGDAVSCHASPAADSAVVAAYAKIQDAPVACVVRAQDVDTLGTWLKTSDGCYISHGDNLGNLDNLDDDVAAILTGDICVDAAGGDVITEEEEEEEGVHMLGDDYPYKGSCGGVDPWNYYKCQCTSFVAWRINDIHGIKFHNQYKGAHWGNANSWDDAAKATGVTVNGTPKVGAIAQSNAGSYGHVAWVSAVSGGSVTVEEYNYATSEGYGKRTVSKGTFNYIHVKA